MKSFRWILGALAMLALVNVSLADVPTKMSYQGYLEQDGQAVSGTHQMTFLLYDQSTGGAPFWLEEKSLTVANGLLQTYLGDATSLPSDLYTHTQLFLSVVIEGDTLSPRTELASVPYAFLTQMANQAMSAQTAVEATLADSARAASHATTADFAEHASYADSSGTGGGGGDTYWAGDGGNIHNTNPGTVIIEAENAQPKLEIKGDGGVIRHTSNGSTLLEVGTNEGQSLFKMFRTDGSQWFRADGNNGSISLTAPSTSTNWAVSFRNAYSDVRLAHPNGQGFWFNSTSPNPENVSLLFLSQDGQSRFLVRGDGKVGIGTVSPAYTLDVNGDARVQGGEIFGINGIQGLGDVSSGWYSDNTNLAARIPGANGYFGIQNNGATTTYFRVDLNGFRSYQNGYVDGNFGVGTTNPGYKLDVNGYFNASRYYLSGLEFAYRPDSDTWRINDTGGSPRIEINDNSDVLLGGPVTIDGQLDQTGDRIVNLGTPVNPNDAATKEYVDTHVGGGEGYWGLNGTHIYNTNTGSVGVGTTAPDSRYKVHINANTGFDQGEGLHVVNNDTDHNTFAIYGETKSRTNGIPPTQEGAGSAVGVYGRASSITSTGGATLGVLGINNAETTSGDVAAGVFGQAPGNPPQGENPTNFDGSVAGVWGETWSTSTEAAGVVGKNNATSGTTKGVAGETKSPDGRAVYGLAINGGYGGWFDGKVHIHDRVTIEIGDVALRSSGKGVILKAPNGNCFRLKVNNDGSLTTEPVSCP